MVPVQENSQVAGVCMHQHSMHAMTSSRKPFFVNFFLNIAMGNGGMIQNCTDDHTQNTLLQVDIKPFTYNAGE